ncbi:hypothetical protein T636_A1549 [Enterobacter hormaechei subsp. xiangfangensis]|nr:hypothetical protein T636_A1549 [Enterobacter hormaechei subsp. xiangfangensis]
MLENLNYELFYLLNATPSSPEWMIDLATFIAKDGQHLWYGASSQAQAIWDQNGDGDRRQRAGKLRAGPRLPHDRPLSIARLQPAMRPPVEFGFPVSLPRKGDATPAVRLHLSPRPAFRGSMETRRDDRIAQLLPAITAS